MLFNSVKFGVFFIGVLLLYYVIPKKFRYLWLLVTSYIFYGAWNVKYLALLFGITFATYLCGLIMDKIGESDWDEKKKKNAKKLTLGVGIVGNIGLLIYFKYMDFFAFNIYRVLGVLGIEVTEHYFNILLPVGISFITFQALGYAIDVYRGRLRAEKNLLKYALFVSFFPQLVAGPIERSENLLTQIQNIHLQPRITYEKFTNGAILMLYGYFQKVFIADKAAILANTVFAAPEQYTTIELALGAIAFSIQIYCDFGGYSNIAIGSAQMLGFEMMENFNAPYFATSIKDFWRRWHISLSSWFKDYLYIPLGGNRCSKVRKYFNLMVTFLVSGLWHGAQMTFVVWGGIHGLIQIIESEAKELAQKIGFKVKTDVFSYRLLQILATYFITTIAWIFFRADNVSIAFTYIAQMFTNFDFAVLFNGSLFKLGLVRNDMAVLCIGVVILFITDYLRSAKGVRIEKYLATQNLWFKWVVVLVFLFSTILFGEYGVNYDAAEFIYFQF
ncbi:MAG: MBOAT family protein [Roseburia sp.]|nr:MBOAT family protein [Roseburia sp.]